MRVLGVDPGKSGGFGWITDSNVCAFKMPETERDIWELLRGLAKNSDKAVIEKVHSMPGQGVSSTFKFGMSYGGLRMALIAAGVPFETVAPGTWQRAMGCLTKGDKNVSKRKAQELYPDIKVTHATADALLIAEYGRRHGD